MGLFGKIFEKKTCDICGGEIGLLGNRKLEDGNLCKNCAGKLSPWFDERRHSTVEQIRQQLEYREQNKAAVAAFHTTRSVGKNMKVLLDEHARKFMVTSAKNLAEANPDVLDLSQIVSCEYEIKESRYEEKQTVKDAEGKSKQVSYIPPHYTYSYDFRIMIGVNHPYFDDISFSLNSLSVKIQSVGELRVGTVGGYGSARGQSFGQVAVNAAKQGVMGAVGMPSYTDPRMTNPEYVEYYNMCNEIKDTLLGARAGQMAGSTAAGAAIAAETPLDEVIRKAEAIRQTQELLNSIRPEDATSVSFFGNSAAEAGPMTCPVCGASTTPDAAGSCEYCGSKIK